MEELLSELSHAGLAHEAESTGLVVTFHKQILEWQAAHPNITWIGWGIVWAIVLVVLVWPRRLG